MERAEGAAFCASGRSSSLESAGSDVELLPPRRAAGRQPARDSADADVARALEPTERFGPAGWRGRWPTRPSRRAGRALATLCLAGCLLSVAFLVHDRVLPAMSQQREASDSSIVFSSFGDGSGAYACFRIPALLAVPALDATHRLPVPLAARTRLLAFAEGRRRNCADAGDIDTVLRMSDDGGATWGPLRVVASALSAGYAGAATVGNPTPIYDALRDRVALLLAANAAADTEGAIIARTAAGSRHVFALHSDDRGRSWSRPRNVSDACKRADWTWYATGPGAAIQLRSGRLLAPANHVASPPANRVASPLANRVASPLASGGGGGEAAAARRRQLRSSPSAPLPAYASHALLSDDGGETWRLGGVGPDGGNEATAAQLPHSDDVLLSMRQMAGKGQRLAAISRDGGESWLPEGYDPQLIEPGCQGHLLAVPPAAERGAASRAAARGGAGLNGTAHPPPPLESGGLLFSNPDSSDARRDLTLKFRPSAPAAGSAGADRTAARSGARGAGVAGAAADPLWSGVGGWARQVRVWTGPAAYSALALVGGEAVGVLFEHGLGHDGFWAQRISFRTFDLAAFEAESARARKVG